MLRLTCHPVIDRWYSNRSGIALKVIGLGTHGIIVEYLSGNVELLDRQSWEDLGLTEGLENRPTVHT